MNQYSTLKNWMVPFFSDLFACQNHPPSRHITLDNLSKEERMIIKNHLPTLLFNFMKCTFFELKRYEREFLSGLVLFRVEILPIFRNVFDPNERHTMTPYIHHLNYCEKHLKKVVLAGYSEGNFKTINVRYFRSVTEEIRATNKWWNDDFEPVDDLIDSLAQEYALDD